MPVVVRMARGPGKRPVLVERKPRPTFGIADPDRREVASVTLRLPMPPSVNAIHSYGKGRVFTSITSEAWRKAAGIELNLQKPGRIAGPYALSIKLCRAETRIDLDNGCKEISDLLQAHRVIANDRRAERVLLEWGADTGAIVTVVATRESAA